VHKASQLMQSTIDMKTIMNDRQHICLGDKWADSDDDSATIHTTAVVHPSRRRINEQPVREGTVHNPNR
jgi:hypothetical protein